MIKPIVVKIGGSTLGNHDTTLQDLVALQKREILPVVIHGGAKKVTQWLEQRGASSRFVGGLRVTDQTALEVVAAVLGGLVNTELVAAINALGGKAVGMTGVDGNLIEARVENPDLGYVGKVEKVNPEAVKALLDAGFMSVIAPPCAKAAAEKSEAPFLNINGDDIAAALAGALRAPRLIFLTDVDGIRGADGKVIPHLTADEVRSLMASGVISGGMIPKAEAALNALKSTPLVQIIDGRWPHALLGAIEGKALGTAIS